MPDQYNSPIKLEFNADCFLMEGMNGVLTFRLTPATDSDGPLNAKLCVRSQILPEPVTEVTPLYGCAPITRSFQVHIEPSKATRLSSAGHVVVDVDLVFDLGDEEGKHRYNGQFVVTVLAYCENRSEVNITIDSVIKQEGEKVGWGAVNDVNLGNLVNLPESKTVNDFLNDRRVPDFCTIDLYYRGPVEDEGMIIEAGGQKVKACAVREATTGNTLLVRTRSKIVLGRSRKESQIVTWFMPMTDDNTMRSRTISGQHVELRFDEQAGDATVTRHVTPNAPQLDDDVLQIGRPVPLPLQRPSYLQMVQDFNLTITPMPFPVMLDEAVERCWLADAGPETRRRWQAGRQSRVGGFLITRADALAIRESYLWLLSAVTVTGTCPVLRQSDLILAAVPSIGVARGACRQDVRSGGRELAKPASLLMLSERDSVSIGSESVTIGPWEQDLGV